MNAREWLAVATAHERAIYAHKVTEDERAGMALAFCDTAMPEEALAALTAVLDLCDEAGPFTAEDGYPSVRVLGASEVRAAIDQALGTAHPTGETGEAT